MCVVAEQLTSEPLGYNKMKLLSVIWEVRHPRTFLASHVMRPVRMFVGQAYERYTRKTTEGVLTLRELFFKAGLIALITSCVVWFSVFLYIAFYYSYMPNIIHTRPVHLQFRSCDGEKGICSFPSSHIELTRRQQLLMVGQSYKIKLALDMPESEANKQLGMFLCCMELRARGGTLVSNSCRSGMLPYKSQLLTLMMATFYSPLLISGFKEERTTVEVELFSDFEDGQETPVTDIYVEIQSRYIQIYSATLFIEAHFSGLRYIMFHWPMLSAVVGISTNLLFVAFVCVLSWYQLQLGNEDKESFDENGDIKKVAMDPFMDSEDFQDLLDIGSVKKEDDDSQSSDLGSFDDPIAGSSVPIRNELESQA